MPYEISLQNLLASGEDPDRESFEPDGESPEALGDQQVLARNYSQAAKHYSETSAGGIRVAEKVAWCHYWLSQWPETVAILQPFSEAEVSPLAKTLLAIGLMQGWSGFHNKSSDEDRQRAKDLLDAVLTESRVPMLAYRARCELWFGFDDTAMQAAIAFKVVKLRPDLAYYRRRAAALRHKLDLSDEEAFAILCEGLQGSDVDEAYLWLTHRLAAQQGDFELALRCLGQLTALIADYRDLDNAQLDELFAVIDCAQANVLADRGDIESAKQLWRAVAARPWGTGGGDGPDSLAVNAHLCLLDAAAGPENMGEVVIVVRNLLAYLRATPATIKEKASAGADLIGPFYFPDGESFGLEAVRVACYEDVLKEALAGEELGLMLWLLAIREPEEEGSEEQMLRVQCAANYMLHPTLEREMIWNVYLYQEPIPWRRIGETWTRTTMHDLDQCGSSAFYGCVLSYVDGVTPATVREFAVGMMVELSAESRKVPGARKIFSPVLRQRLLDENCDELFLGIARQINRIDAGADSCFDYALGEQRAGERLLAAELYWLVLKEQPKYYAAIYNLLLIYRAFPSLDDVNRLATMIEGMPSDAFTSVQWQELRESLVLTREGANKPSAATLRAVAVEKEFAKYGSVIGAAPAINEVSFDNAVALLTLFRTCPTFHSEHVLEGFDHNVIPFSPTVRQWRQLFGVLEKHLVGIDRSTPAAAFSVNDGESTSYYFGQVRWRVSAATLYLTQQLEEVARSKQWPASWYGRARELAQELAVEECVAYLNHLASERRFPDPDATKSRLLFEGLLSDFSVSECYYFSYLAARAASDHKQKLPVNAAQAANVMLLRCQQTADRARNEQWEVKRYDRLRDVPRSAMSCVLHDVFTGLGENAFREPLKVCHFPDQIHIAPRSSSLH